MEVQKNLHLKGWLLLEHPNPYHVSWVKDEHKILVSEKCLMRLKIGPFTDEIVVIFYWVDLENLTDMLFMMEELMQEHPRVVGYPTC